MPRIPDEYLECAIYLYPTVEGAGKGEQSGGSGLLVYVPSKTHSDAGYIYAVTCSHVATDNPVIRLNTCKGDIGVLDYSGKWEHHANDDLAAVHMGALDTDQFKFKLLELQRFINQEIIYRFDIGPGDEVFMVGRFITEHNQQRNAPSVRFGNISMIYAEPVFNIETGKDQEGIAVEMRSIPGYSGSPVFVYTPFDEHHHPWSERRRITTWGTRQRQVPLSQINVRRSVAFRSRMGIPDNRRLRSEK
jgi:hypothetical protein